MFDPKFIRHGVKKSPRKIIIFGPPKAGKSSLASTAPDALLVPTEDRVDHIVSAAKTEVVKSYQEILDIIKYLRGGSPYKTFILDTLDWAENLLHAYVCEKKGVSSLTDNKDPSTNYGRGLKYLATEEWRHFLSECDSLRIEQGMSIVLVAHSQVEKVNLPDVAEFDRYTLKLDKNATAILIEYADVVAFYNHDIIVSKEDAGFGRRRGKAVPVDNTRTLHMEATSPAWLSGNSYGLGDAEVTIENSAEVMKYILNSGEQKEQKIKNNKTKE